VFFQKYSFSREHKKLSATLNCQEDIRSFLKRRYPFTIIYIFTGTEFRQLRKMTAIENTYVHDPNEHAVIIFFNYGKDEDEPYWNLGMELEKILRVQRLGVYDGHEIAMDNTDGSYYMYGPNAEAIFKAIKPTLDATDFMKGATAMLRFGPGEDSPVLELEL
jgi:hypothetical protein